MNFKFEVEDMILRQIKSHNHSKDDLNNLFCSFVFTTPEWKHIEKYAVFWNRKGKSTIRYLGDKTKCTCELPEMVLNDLHFFVQVYANDEVHTQKLKVFTQKDVPIQNPHKPTKNDFSIFFKEMENKIDNIVMEDGKFLIYANNKLIKSFDVVDEALLSRILAGITPQLIFDTATSEASDLPIACKVVYKVLKDKVDIGDLSMVAFTGDYNDLENIPNEFNPQPHTHQVDDIEDFNDSVEEDFDDFIEDLTNSLYI